MHHYARLNMKIYDKPYTQSAPLIFVFKHYVNKLTALGARWKSCVPL